MLDLLQVAIKSFDPQLLREVYSRWLACGPFGQVRHDDQNLRAPLVLQCLATHQPLPQLEELDGLPFVKDNDDTHGLAQHLVRAGEAQDVLDSFVLPDGILHLERGYLLPCPVDEFLESSNEVQVAVLVDPALVATSHEAIGERLLIRVFVHVRPHLVALHDARPLNTHLALLSRLHPSVAGVAGHDRQLGAHRWPDGLQLPGPVPGVGAEGVGLGHGVGGHDGGLELALHLLRQAGQESCRVVADDPKVVVKRLLVCFLHLPSQLHQRQVVGGNS
mmetsp:Transcript_86424/g.252894  ORF Transcript_86424/g.252894 Transcript_86424/m.252894 type:complete len:276 (+) Transcript_86424:80-907(+)